MKNIKSILYSFWKRVLYFSIIGFFLTNASVFSKASPVVNKHLTTAYGLPSDFIYELEFDNEGLLWMATTEGLVRYDGTNSRVFNLRNAAGVSHEWSIHHLCNIQNKIWFSDFEGELFYFDKLNQSIELYPLDFKQLDSKVKIKISFLFKDALNKLWIGIYGMGIIQLNPESGDQVFFQHEDDNENSIISNYVQDICQDEIGNYWIATEHGISVLEQPGYQFHHYTNSSENENLLLSNNILSIVIDPSGYVWLGTAGHGLCKFDPTSHKRVDFTKTNSFALSHNYVNDLFVDSNSHLWISTKNGLNRIDLENHNNGIIKIEKDDVKGLTSNRISQVAQTIDGSIWIATFGGGINIVQNTKSRFNNTLFNVDQEMLIGLDIVQLQVDSKNNIWIGTLTKGILVFDEKGNYLSKISNIINERKKNDCLSNQSLHFYNGKMYYGFDSKNLYYLEYLDKMQNSEFKLKKFQFASVNIDVNDIYFSPNEQLWLLSSTGAYLVSNGQIVDSVITNNPVQIVTSDYRGRIWIGTFGDGLYIYNPQESNYQHFIHVQTDSNSICGDEITYLFEDNSGIMWVGTLDGGLCYYNRNNNVFLHHLDNNDLISSSVHSIIEGDDENLWIALGNGLLKLDPETGKSILFGYGQGLPRNIFNPKAVIKKTNGDIFFGTENGIISFNPSKIELAKEYPPIEFTDFRIFNKSIFSENDYKDKRKLFEESSITLASNENFIGIEFAAIELNKPEQIHYKYRLLGIENDWVYPSNNNFVSYLNIPSGKYIFQLSSTNTDGVWNPECVELQINIKAPLYAKTWFIVVVIILFSLIVSFFIILRIRASSRMTKELEKKVDIKTRQLKESNIQLQQEVEERKFAEEQAEKANKTKSEFLANMSHEIRTPMNSIIGFTDLLTSLVKDEKQQYYLESIKSSGRSLLVLINDILDLSKIEAGKFDIDYQTVNLRNLVEDIRQVFTLKCDEKDLVFNTKVDENLPAALILSDTRLRQIFVNIVGNAIKFTDRGSISINVYQIAAPVNTGRINIQIDICDTGVGIPQEQQESIFNAFHQQEGQEFNKYGGTGLGLTISRRLMELMGGKIHLKSTVGVGTTFSLYLNDVPISEETIKSDSRKNISNLNDIDLSSKSILIVDDSKSNRNLIKEFLNPTQAILYEAGNGQEAYEKAKDLLPNIIFLDIRMPVMNGLETAKALKSYKPTSEIPLVAFTASISYTETDKYEKAGFNAVLLKPVQMNELYDVISENIEFDRVEEMIVEESNADLFDNGFENIRIIDLKAALEELTILLPEWELIKENHFINTVLDFSSHVLDIGNNHQIKSIIRYAKRLRLFAESVDTEKMEKTLTDYTLLIEELNSYLND